MCLLTIATCLGATSPDAPGPAREMEALFDPGSLTGQVWITAPLKTVSGDDLSGYLTYRMKMNGTLIKEDRVFYGSSKATDVTVPAPGVYEFSVTFLNDAGESDPASITVGIGNPQPATPVATATRNGDQVIISWNPVTKDVNGSSLSGVTYKVMRMPEYETLATDLTATTYTDTPPTENGAEAYYYDVYAVANSTASEPGSTNCVVCGHITPPWTENFPTSQSLEKFIQIDGNNDGKTWDFYYGELYIHDTSNDWLISPPVMVSADSFYTFSIRGRARNEGYPPTFRLCWGTEPTAEAMTNVIIPTTTVASEQYNLYSMNARPGVDGLIYIGVLNEENNDGLLITDLSISAPILLSTPGELQSFSAVSDSSGARHVNISLKTPAKTIDDKALTAISKVEVYRNETLVHTFSNPAPNAELTCEDSGMTEEGEYTYSALAYGEGGAGPKSVCTTYVGINIPASPQWARVKETDVDGTVTVEWDVPTTYKDGRPIDPSTITFNIYTPIGGSDTKIYEGLTGSSFTFPAIQEDTYQYMYYYCVTSQNSAGENFSPAVTEMIPVGLAYEAPYEDSFPMLEPLYLYGLGTEEFNTYWDFASDRTFPGITTYDGDGGMLRYSSQEIGYRAYIFSGKISVDKLQKPALTFYVYNNSEDADNTIEVELNDRNGWVSAGTYRVGDLGADGWQRVAIPLTSYIGKSVQFKLIGKSVSSNRILVDNVRIVDRFDRDMAVTDVRIPKGVKAGNEVTVGIDYQNEGLLDAQNVTFEFLIDGEVSDSQSVSEIASDAKGSVSFVVNHDINAPESSVYRVDIKYASDENAANNTTGDCEVKTRFPQYPAVNDLVAGYGEENPSTVYLKWSEPSLDVALVDDITDDFESYSDWATTIDNWTFYDVDEGEIYGFGSWVYLPGIGAGSQQSWWIQNGDYEQLFLHFFPTRDTRAHSGSKYLAQNAVLKNETEIKCDDWLVSPMLYGGEQTVSLWAKSFFDTDPETFEVYVSDSGNAVSDFTLLKTVSKVPGGWTEYFFDIPEGTRYFAIRCISRDCFMLMIDDICYTPEARATVLERAGYNVYRDGVRLNSEPVVSTHYQVTDAEHIAHYQVTALYAERGESPLSNSVVAELNSVADIFAGSVKVVSAPGAILVNGAAGQQVCVYSVDGRRVADRFASDSERFNLSAGAYVVTVGNKSYKLIVK